MTRITFGIFPLLLLYLCLINTNAFNLNNTSLRGLFDDSQRNKINELCNKSSSEVKDYFFKGEGKFDPKKNLKGLDDKYVKIIFDLIDGNSDGLLDYLMKVVIWIGFIGIGFLSLIGWFIYCICCCCGCCCCKKTDNSEPICRLVLLILLACFFGIVIGISLYTFNQLGILMKGFNGTSCTLMKFYQELIEGQTANIEGKWEGIEGISNKLEETADKVSKIDSNKIDSEGALQKVSDYKKSSSYSQISFKSHFDSNTSSIIGFITVLKKSTTGINNETSSILDLKDIIDGFVETFSSFEDNVISPWLDYENYIQKYGKLIFKVVGLIYFAFSVLIIVFSVLFILINKGIFASILCCLVIFIHFFWNILMLLSFITLIVAPFFGIIGTIGKDAVSVLGYIVSEDNLKSSDPKILTGNAASYLATCLTGDGDLSSLFDLGTDNKVNEIIRLEEELKIAQKNLAFLEGKKSEVKSVDYNNTIEKLSDNVEASANVITPLVDIFGSIGKGGNAFNISNCGFMKGNLDITLVQLKKGLGDNFYNFGIALTMAALACPLGIVFLILILRRYSKLGGKKEEKKENQ